MKKISYFLLSCLLVSCSAGTTADSAIEKIKNDLPNYELSGKVKSVTTRCYDLRYYGESEISSISTELTRAYPKTLLCFNDEGYMTSRCDYNSEEELYLTFTRELRPDNQIITQTKVSTIMGTSVITNWYNDKNLVFKREEKDGDRVSCQDFFKYDENGRLVEQTHEYSGSQNVDRMTTEYNKNGLPCLQVQYDENGNETQSCDTKYDKLGNVVEETIRDARGNKVAQFSYKYDNRGLQIEKNVVRVDYKCSILSEYDNHGYVTKRVTKSRETETWTFSYVYDEQGNWIERTSFNEGFPVAKEKRIIEYYNF